MKEGQIIDLGMTGYAELFMTDQERKENTLPKIVDIPLDQIDDFPNHPFQVRMDEDMQQLVESIKERGIITPVILRKKDDGRFEIVSGHRRKKACEIAGLQTLKAEIREMTRDEAIILMVESNLQRSVILPSEKAFSYKMRLDAMKRQAGRPSKENMRPVGTNIIGTRSDEQLAEESPDSARQIQRYIRLTFLIPDILQMVDEGRIALRPAVELSYLTEKEQGLLLEAIEYAQCTPSHAQAIRLRALSRDGNLGPHIIESILNEEKPNQKERITVQYAAVRKYIPSHIPFNQTGDYIVKALDFYQRYQERKKNDRGDR